MHVCVSLEVVPALHLVASIDGSGLTMLRHSRGRLGGKYDLHCQRKEGRKGGSSAFAAYNEAVKQFTSKSPTQHLWFCLKGIMFMKKCKRHSWLRVYATRLRFW